MTIVKISVVVLLLVSVCFADMAEQKAMLIGIASECKITENASDDDMGKLVEKKPPTTKEGKCLFACIMEEMDVVRRVISSSSWTSASNYFLKYRFKMENSAKKGFWSLLRQ